MSDTEESESFLETVKKLKAKREEIEALEKLLYDGVRGLPPDWFPEVFINDFRRTRGQLIQLYEGCEEPLTLTSICDLILDQIISDKPFVPGCPGFRSDNFFYPISVLKRYREISVMAENDGIEELAGINIYQVKNEKLQENRSLAGQQTAKQKKEQAQERYQEICRLASELINQNKEKKSIAGIIARRLSCSKDVIYRALKNHSSGLWK